MPVEAASRAPIILAAKPKRLIALAEVIDRTSLSRTSLWRKVKNGEFPPPVRISAGRKAWLEDSVNAWIDARVAEAAE
jgi:prophage regulatory protein